MKINKYLNESFKDKNIKYLSLSNYILEEEQTTELTDDQKKKQKDANDAYDAAIKAANEEFDKKIADEKDEAKKEQLKKDKQAKITAATKDRDKVYSDNKIPIPKKETKTETETKTELTPEQKEKQQELNKKFDQEIKTATDKWDEQIKNETDPEKKKSLETEKQKELDKIESNKESEYKLAKLPYEKPKKETSTDDKKDDKSTTSTDDKKDDKSTASADDKKNDKSTTSNDKKDDKKDDKSTTSQPGTKKERLSDKINKIGEYTSKAVLGLDFGISTALIGIVASIVGIGEYFVDKFKDDDDEEAKDQIQQEYIDKNLAIAKSFAGQEQDGEKKEGYLRQIGLFTASRYDDDGKPLSAKETSEQLQQSMGKEKFEELKNNTTNEVKTGMQDGSLQKLDKESQNITKEQLQQSQEEDKDLSWNTKRLLKKEIKKETKEDLKELEKEYDEKIDAAKDDTEKDKLKTEYKQKKEELKKFKETTIDYIKTDLEDLPAITKTPEEIAAAEKEINNKFDEQKTSKTTEFDKKIADEKDEAKKEQLKKDKETALQQIETNRQNELTQNKNNSSDKPKEKVIKDKDGNVLKREEVTDAEGKKIKVITHTGPRGGKFYYPKGAPKNDEHKVYVQESLSNYIFNLLNN